MTGSEPSARSELRVDARDGSTVIQALGNVDFTHTDVPPPPAMHTLLQDVADFTGRDIEMRRLLGAADPTQVVAIHAVDGMPGVGKTALVRRAAHLLADRFPHGQLFVGLHAHTPGQAPADPSAVLASLLDKTGLSAQDIPADLDGRAARWRSRLADKKVLLILDDAAGSAQVRPLLPGSPGCLTLVTSRRRLVDLEGAVPLPLETLPPHQAALLFTRLAHRTPTGGETNSVAETVRLCGYLPLAIALLAGRLAHHPAWTLAHMAAEFAAAKDRLRELAAGELAVAAAFDLSYQQLHPEQQRLFRRLSLHPGLDLDAYAAAALDNISLFEARDELETLYTDHLLDEPTPGRYRLHDLLRAYARALAIEKDPASERGESIERLLNYYQHTAQVADHHLAIASRPGSPPAIAPPAATPALPNRTSALAWMRAEHANLLACLDHASSNHQAARIVHLTAAMATYLHLERPWPQAAALCQRASTAAFHTRDRLGQANALNDLGRVRSLTGQYDEAADLQQRALALYQDVGDRLGQAKALNDLGRVRELTGQYDEAADLQQRALALYQDVGDHHGQASTLNDLGSVRELTGQYDEAADLQQRALALYQDVGDRLGQANALNDLGRVRELTGQYKEAAKLQQRAISLFQEIGNRHGQANALNDLGRVRSLTGKYKAAARLQQRALALYQEVGERHGQASTLNDLGRVRSLTGKYEAAARLQQRALTLYQEVGDPQGEAEVLNNIGALLAESAGPQEALAAYRRALQLARRVHSPLDEARALEGTARCQAQIGKREDGLADLRQAVGIYKRIGAAEAKPAAANLMTLEGEFLGGISVVQDSTDS